MSISLFPHNQKAYEALLNVLEVEHGACVIHPTDTGKSFIGFWYCEDHPQQTVLWLSLGNTSSNPSVKAELPDVVLVK